MCVVDWYFGSELSCEVSKVGEGVREISKGADRRYS